MEQESVDAIDRAYHLGYEMGEAIGSRDGRRDGHVDGYVHGLRDAAIVVTVLLIVGVFAGWLA